MNIGRHLRYYVLLASLAAIAPLTLDLYLPALPVMAHELEASESVVQLSLTSCLLGLALGQVAGGPLSDVFGRRAPLLTGLAIYIVSTLALALPLSAAGFIGLRAIEGAAGGTGIVIGTAVVRDRYRGADAARFLSLIVVVVALSPIFAPAIGGQLLLLTPWRGLFVALAVAGALITGAVALWLPETLPPEQRSARSPSGLLGGMGMLLRDREFVAYALPVGLSTAAVLGYISASSFVVQGIYGASPQLFGAVFALNGIALTLSSQANAVLVGRVAARSLLQGAQLVLLAAGACLLVLTLLVGVTVPLPILLVPLLVAVACNAFIGPNGTSLALAPHPRTAGAGAALLGVARFGIGSVMAPLTGVGGPHTAVPLAAVIFSCGGAGVVTHALLYRYAVRRSQPALDEA